MVNVDVIGKLGNFVVCAAAIFCMVLVSLWNQYQNPVFIWILVIMIGVCILLIARVLRKSSSKKGKLNARARQADEILNLAQTSLQEKKFAAAAHNAHYALYLYGNQSKNMDSAMVLKQNAALKVLHVAYIGMKDYPSAVKYGTELLESNARDIEVLWGIAFAKLQLRLYASANDYVQSIFSLDPENRFAKELLDKIKVGMTSKPD